VAVGRGRHRSEGLKKMPVSICYRQVDEQTQAGGDTFLQLGLEYKKSLLSHCRHFCCLILAGQSGSWFLNFVPYFSIFLTLFSTPMRGLKTGYLEISWQLKA